MRAAFDRLGEQPAGLRLDCRNRIPHGRGLGSSAAAIVSGIGWPGRLTVDGRERLDEAGALALATELEGHPDNVAACLLGGLTVAWLAGRGRAGPSGSAGLGVAPVLFIPDEQSATHAARAALPGTVPHADAAFNLSRAALLVLALTGRPDLLLTATEDRLHQRYRAAGMPASAALVDRLRARPASPRWSPAPVRRCWRWPRRRDSGAAAALGPAAGSARAGTGRRCPGRPADRAVGSSAKATAEYDTPAPGCCRELLASSLSSFS